MKRFIDFYKYLIMAGVLNLPLVFLVLLMDLRHIDLTSMTALYLTSLVIGYYGLPLLIVVTLFSPLSFVSRKAAVLSSGIMITIYLFYLLIDGFAYSVAKMHIDLFWLEWIINDYKGLGLSPSALVFAGVALLGIIGAEIGLFRLARKIRKSRFVLFTVPLVIGVAFTVGALMHIVAYQNNDSRITGITPYLPFYIPITSHSNAAKFEGLLPIGETESEIAAMEGQVGSLMYPLAEMTYRLPGDSTPPNIVMILLESWRFDMMNDSVTPNIHALSEKSSVFLDHFSSGNQTICGVFGLFYGLHATYWNAVKANNALIDNPVLIDILQEQGYGFGIFARSNFERHKVKDALFRGIEVHEDFAGKKSPARDADMTRQAIEFMRQETQAKQPFLTFVFYKANHSPYLYPEGYGVFSPAGDINMAFTSGDTDPTKYMNDYRNATRYVDSLIGDILRELDTLGVMDNTVIIVTTDHGESFNDNHANYWGHGSNYTQYQTRVPLVMYIPGRAPQQVAHSTSHIDVPPTLLEDFFGCTTDIADYSNGRNLYDTTVGRRSFVIGSYVNHAFIIDDNVFAIYPMYTKRYKLDDITREADYPASGLLKMTMDEVSRFYGEPGGKSGQ